MERRLAEECQYTRDAKALEPVALQRLSPSSRRLLEAAESEARARDDNHVGTEHIILAIWTLDRRLATRALESVGIIRHHFVAQLHDEAGTSPRDRIPLTPRARMIVALAGAEAKRIGSAAVEPEHILLGVIRESQRWEATGIDGPHHLRHAAAAAWTSLSALEQKLICELWP